MDPKGVHCLLQLTVSFSVVLYKNIKALIMIEHL